jgi:hypothetical protein
MRVDFTITKTQYHLLSSSLCLHIFWNFVCSLYVLRVLVSVLYPAFSPELLHWSPDIS